ncbi:MAG: anaerobic glycerol-3-phosphate dehydrogenase subunit C [Haloquadratum sp.]|nr:anaerobic glycerol-3-phosphate dehydrogenase subunit C [Haloquadratum sp.]
MSDAEQPGFAPTQPNTGTEFEPVQVFPEVTDSDLRSGADSCYKCSTCDVNCPVAAVDDSFPGPKFQGPEQWRLHQRDEEHEIDDSIMSCSNCMRCDNACPSGVPLSQMHNTARAEYVSEQMSHLSVEYWRNRLLSNYRLSAWAASKAPRVANRMLNFGPARWLLEATLGITAEREFPAFATETFRQWWRRRGGAAASRERAVAAREHRGLDADADKKVAYFHGCYSNYNTPEVGRALVRVYEHFGYEVVVPKQGCSGTPMFANGMIDDAARHKDRTLDGFTPTLDAGYDVIASCTSCSMALRQEYPELFEGAGVDALAGRTYEGIEYLRIHEDLPGALAEEEAPADFPDAFAYHAPCHARNQGLARQAVELFRHLEGVTIEDVGESCSGISGTYGWKQEKYEVSMQIGEDMFEHMHDAAGTTGMTECPTCAMQMEHGTSYPIRHPLELLAAVLTD